MGAGTPEGGPDAGRRPAPRLPAGIEADRLAEPDLDAIGTIDNATGGLGVELWQGTPRAVVMRLVAGPPNAIDSPAMRDVVRRTLLTVARPPAASSPPAVARAGAPSGAPDPVALTRQRAARLFEMGQVEAALALADILSPRIKDERLARLRADAKLVLNDRAGACAEAARASNGLDAAYWQRLLVYCQAMAGDTAAAALGTSVMAESGSGPGEVFLLAVDALSGRKPPPPASLPAPTPLLVSMLRTAKLPIPADGLPAAAPPVLRMIAEAADSPMELRLAAAEMAAGLGALPADGLASIYAAFDFSEGELANALSETAEDGSSRGRALLYQAAAAQDIPAARAEILQRVLEAARKNGTHLLAARVHAGMLVTVPPSTALSWFAAEAARALLANGSGGQARRWLAVLDQVALRDADAAEARHTLWPLRQIADGGPLNAAALAAWQDRALRAGPQGERTTEAVLALLEATGQAVPDSAWWAFDGVRPPAPAQLPAYALRRQMQAAAAAPRRGEAVLLAARVRDQAGAAEVAPDGTVGRPLSPTVEAVAALASVGLAEEARALAVEALIERGH